MFTNFMNKIKYIKTKIRIIYKINIDYVNVLFILSKQWQNKNTIDFLNKFDIPYIFINCENKEFNLLNKDLSPLDFFILKNQHHYGSNKNNYERALKDNEINDDLNDQYDDKDIYLLDDENDDNEDNIGETEVKEESIISDILENKFKNNKIE